MGRRRLAAARQISMVTLTAWVAAATLVVMFGVLAGPAITRCAQAGGDLSLCLRGKVIDAGLLPDAALPSVPPIEDSSTAAPLAEDSAPSRDDGWLRANAAEIANSASASVVLAPLPGVLDAGGTLAAPQGDVAGSVTLAEPVGSLSAAGEGPVPPPLTSASLTPLPDLLHEGTAGGGQSAGDTAMLSPSPVLAGASGTLRTSAPDAAIANLAPAGSLWAAGSGASAGAAAAGTTLAAPSGRITPTPSEAPPPTIAATTSLDPVATGDISATGTSTAQSQAALASLVPAPPVTAPDPPMPAVDPPALVPPVVAPKPVSKPKIAPRPKIVLKPDPRFPSIMVLLPPRSGANSSFATLE